jgi:2-polyprenyl-3-methyl-5-hydroxy-6-metoxy-1,4-benzoquinol methylase
MTATSQLAAREAWSPREERQRLDTVARWYDSRKGLNRELIEEAARRVVARARGRRALELGCAMGVMTERLAAHFPELHVVEGSEVYARRARAFVPAERVHHCLFEEFQSAGNFDTIVMSWILEHVLAPRELLARARGWLAPGGELHLVVPNAGSLHRRVGVRMGLLRRLDQMNESDLAVGHRRVYTWERLADDIAAAGLHLISMEGILLKPLSSALMESWDAELRAAFFELAPLAPRLCSEIYAVSAAADRSKPAHSLQQAQRV